MTTTAVNALSHVLILRVLIATIVEPAPGGDHRFREPSRCPERNCRLDTKVGARSMPPMHGRMTLRRSAASTHLSLRLSYYFREILPPQVKSSFESIYARKRS